MQSTLTKKIIVLFYLVLGVLSWGVVSVATVFAGTTDTGLTGNTSVKITELMYAPKGPDAKHEWIEVCNNTSSTVDIQKWKLYENKTNHGLSLSMGSGTLSQNSCAIIADDAVIFRSDYPSFSGILFDSTFSLNNTGETISLKDTTGKVIDTVTYQGIQGAKDDGNSLHRQGMIFVPGAPTPGKETIGSTPVSNSTKSSDTSSTNTKVTNITAYTYDSIKIEPPQDIFIRVPKTMYTTVHALTAFTMESYDSTGKTLSDGNVYWSFGDGASSRERAPVHVFNLPGTYAVRVTLKRNSLMDTKEIVVTVAPLNATIRVATDGSWIVLKNNSTRELDVSNWRLVSGGQYFSIPNETYILPQREVRFSRKITKLTNVLVTRDVLLIYPQGGMALSSRQEYIIAQAAKVIADQKEKSMATPTSTMVILTQSKKKISGNNANRFKDYSRSHYNKYPSKSIVTQSIHIKQNNKQNKISGSTILSTTTREEAAAVVLSSTKNDKNTLQWYAALVVLLVVAVGGVLAARRRRLVVDGYEVVEQPKQQEE